MADPFTVLGSVAASVQLAELIVATGLDLVKLIQKVRDAPDVFTNQIRELEQITGIAQLIIQNETLQTDAVASCLQSCLRTVTALQSVLYKHAPNEKDNRITRLPKVLMSVLREKRVTDLFEQLGREKASLTICINEHVSRRLGSMDANLARINDTTDQTAVEITGVTNGVSEINQTLSEVTDGIANLTTTIPNIDNKIDRIHAASDKIPAMSESLSTIQDLLLPALLEQKARPSLPQRIFHVPNRLVRQFVGREDVLSKIEQAHHPEVCEGTKIFVLQGIGGQGKTQVALQHCERRQKNNPSESVFWLNSTAESSLKADFEYVAELICGPDDALPDTEAGKVSYVLQRLSDWPAPWLLVFDNYDVIEEFGNILDYIPRNDQGMVLVTSRHRDSATLLQDPENFLELQGLDDGAAISLLSSQAGRTNARDLQDLTTVTTRLGNHALAITQAAAYMRKRRLTPDEFLDEYQHRRREILNMTPRLSQYRRRLNQSDQHEIALNVFTTWELSFQQLEKQTGKDSVETKLIVLICLFNERDISERIFQFYKERGEVGDPSGVGILDCFFRDNGWDRTLFIEKVEQIAELSLIDVLPPEDGDRTRHLRLHPLVKDWIKLRSDTFAMQSMCCLATILLGKYVRSFWSDEHFRVSASERQQLLLHAESNENNWSELSCDTFAISKTSVETLGTCMGWLGGLLKDCGRYGTAEPLLCRAWEIEKGVLGESHPNALHTMGKLGGLYRSMGRYSQAENLEVEVIRLRKALLEEKQENFEEDLDLLTCMGNLALTYSNQGRWDEARALEIQVMNMSQKVLGENHPETLLTMNNMTITYMSEGRWEEAQELCEKAVEVTKFLRPDHPDPLFTMSNLASIRANKLFLEEAVAIEEEVVEKSKRIFGDDQPDTLIFKNNLAGMYAELRRWEEAETLQAEVVESKIRLLGGGHPSSLKSLENLAVIYSCQGRRNEVEHVNALIRDLRGT